MCGWNFLTLEFCNTCARSFQEKEYLIYCYVNYMNLVSPKKQLQNLRNGIYGIYSMLPHTVNDTEVHSVEGTQAAIVPTTTIHYIWKAYIPQFLSGIVLL